MDGQNDGVGYEPRQLAPGVVFLPNSVDDDAVFLSLMPKGYDGNRIRIHVNPNEPWIGSPGEELRIPLYRKPGVNVTPIEGCGYYGGSYSPEEAEALAKDIEKNRVFNHDSEYSPRQFIMSEVEANRVAELIRAAITASVEAHAKDPNLTPEEDD